MDLDHINSCCGIGELVGIDETPKAIVARVYEDSTSDMDGLPYDRYNMIVFTDNVKFKNGAKLAAYIKYHKLGEVTASPIVWNPSRSSRVRMWTWLPNWKKIDKMFK